MKKLVQHIKTSGIMTGSGMISATGAQLIGNSLHGIWQNVILFSFMTGMGVVSKLVLDKVAVKGEK